MNYKTTGNPGVGPAFSNIEFPVWNRTGATVALGDIVMLDHLAADGASLSTAAPNAEGTPGGQLTWPLGNAINPATTGIGVSSDDPGSWFGVVISLMDGAGADNTKVMICMQGLVKCKCLTTEPVVFGDDLYPADGVRTLTPTQTDVVRCLAKAVGAKADNATNLVLCVFNGDAGIGVQTFAS
jgi:hypothetical protein